MAEIAILLVGNNNRSEFHEARAVLEATGCVVAAPDVESAAEILGGDRFAPDLVVVAQAYPGQFSHRAIDRLRRLAPLARMLALLGSWCEGEMRTGKPWPGAIRIYWHQWLTRCGQELPRLRRGQCPTWGLPITATEDERLLLGAEQPLARRQGLVAIHARRIEMSDWLSAACRWCGYWTVWLKPPWAAEVGGAMAAIFDGADCRGEELAELEHLAATLRGVPVIALLDFPRVEDRNRALCAGAAAVLSKPPLLDDLLWQLDRLSHP